MTEQSQITLNPEILNVILEHGLAGLPDALSLLINHAMLIKRSKHLGAAPYQRELVSTGHANGFKDRRLDPRMGTLDLPVPQTRITEVAFFPSALERGQRSEKALTLAIAEPTAGR